tara:strand:+ start:1016 stop:1834 length:819 start_codon:yes stop_codon:yes gene_type:complete
MNKNENKQFENKWGSILKKGNYPDEKTLFVSEGENPKTQRQFNLYHYFEFINTKVTHGEYKTALEVGCGRGTIGLYLDKYLDMDVTLLDSSQEAIDLAKYNFDLWNGDGEFIVGDVRKLAFADESFDVIVSIGLLEHLEDYASALSEQYRVLKKGGMIISLNIPQKKSVQLLNTLYRKVLKKTSKQNLQKDYYRNKDKPKDYKKNAEKVGFSDVKVFYVNPFPLFTPLGKTAERILTVIYGLIYSIRSLIMKYPFRGSRMLSQAHFLTGKKK